jgi:hypothetical protein
MRFIDDRSNPFFIGSELQSQVIAASRNARPLSGYRSAGGQSRRVGARRAAASVSASGTTSPFS